MSIRIRTTCAVGVAVASALAAAGAGRSAAGLCVGGPHCYATIAAAVAAAHDGDAIRIAPGTYGGGIVLEKSVDLVGSGAQSTVVSGGGPVLTIGSATSTPTVSISGLTITSGLTTTNPQAPHCGPDVPRCGPGYSDATALGGGIEAFPGTTVTIRSSIVTGNRAEPAVSVPSVKAVCPLGPCPASFADAAGIDNWGTMTIESSTVSDNRAAAVQSNGGGIVDEAGASLTLLRSRVTGNSANAVAPWGRFASGGGVFVAGGASLRVDESAIDGNAATVANAIPHPYPQQDGNTDAANAFAGGVFLADGSAASIRNSTLDGNAVRVQSAVGEPFGADAALCACGEVALTLENGEVAGNRLAVDTFSSADVGPSGGILEADTGVTIRNLRVVRNDVSVRSATGDAGAVGVLTLLWFGGATTTSISGGSVSDNTVTATAPLGAATIQGVGIANNGPLLLENVQVDRNAGTATGRSGYAQGGGIWNGQLFGDPYSPLTLANSRVGGNVLAGSPGVSLAGGGIFTPGFPVTLDHAVVARNLPDDCAGC